MKRLGHYKHFLLCEVTETDAKKAGNESYDTGDIVCFLPDDEHPALHYEDWQTSSIKEMHDFIDCY